MSVAITVDVTSPTPVYEQIRSQIAELVLTGGLALGARLPPVRTLASDLGIAVNTVARAYHELESEGYVRSRRRSGTSVIRDTSRCDLEPLRALAAELVNEARRSGVEAETIIALLRQEFADVPTSPGGSS